MSGFENLIESINKQFFFPFQLNVYLLHSKRLSLINGFILSLGQVFLKLVYSTK